MKIDLTDAERELLKEWVYDANGEAACCTDESQRRYAMDLSEVVEGFLSTPQYITEEEVVFLLEGISDPFEPGWEWTSETTKLFFKKLMNALVDSTIEKMRNNMESA